MAEDDKTKIKKRNTNVGNCNHMVMTGNLSHNWKKWYQSFKLYIRASSLEDETDSRKVAIFLHLIGEKGLEIFNSFQKDEDKITYKELVNLFQSYFVPKENLTYESYKFFTYKQNDTESLEDFACNLKTLSQTCNFDNMQDRLVKIMFICHLHPKYAYLQEKLLLDDDLNMENALEIAKTTHRSRAQAENLQNITVNYVSRTQSSHRSKSRSKSNERSHTRSQMMPTHNKTSQGCSRCGQVHRVRCPAINAKCKKCSRIGHFAICCRTRNVRSIESEPQVESQYTTTTQDFFVASLTTESGLNEWVIQLKIDNIVLNCLLDTGSDTNIMPRSVYNSLNLNSPLSPCHIKVKSYTNNYINILGSQKVLCSYKINDTNVTKEINFVIADVNSRTVLGKDTCTELGLVKRVYSIESSQVNASLSESQVCHANNTEMSQNSQPIEHCYTNSSRSVKSNKPNMSQCKQSSSSQLKSNMLCQSLSSQSQPNNLNNIIHKYDKIFSGLGCLPGECHITVDPTVSPKIDAPRKVPFALYNNLKLELEKMENLNVITKVTEPTKWVSSLLLVEKKNGQLRVCLDPRNLNMAIQRTHYPIMSVDSVRSKVTGAKYYSTLDACSGFWMISLDEESSFLTTFNTPFGRYRFKRLPYGVNCAPEYFHRVMTETFGDIPGVIVYSDDILVTGHNLMEHNERLTQVFERALIHNVKFNREKRKFACSEVKYLGHIFSGQGVTVDPDKIRAIQEMPSPSCTKDLQRFLGMLNYLSSFINNLAAEVAPLRELLKKNSTFVWNSNYEQIFNHLKSLICRAPVLSHFDVNLPIKLSVDASSTAVGAVLLQKEHPVYYISKTLTESQQKMAQIEKELYAIVFAVVRFHQFIYGQTVKVETDHRPLITLFKKPLVEVPTRLQRMMMKIQSYNLDVVYKKGTEMYIADTLSRAPLSETGTDELDNDIIVHVNLLIKSLPVSPERLQWLKNATNSDESMNIIKMFCKNGWPSCKSKVPDIVKPYWCYRHDIHTEHDLVFKNHAIVIPKNIRSDIMKIIHQGHFGVDRSKSFARGSVFWPFMSSEIKNVVDSCEICLTHRKSNSPEPLMPHNISSLPWEKVGIDFLDFKNKKYLVIEDYYSNFIELIGVTSTNANSVITVLKSVFSRHGIPVELFSDNGPPFTSVEFKSFIFDWGIMHNTSSPHLPRSNGLVESGVKICKRILTKCEEAGTDPHLALLQYRNTPRGNIPSPAQLLMSRTLRTQLPIITQKLKPKVVHFKDYLKAKEDKNNKIKEYYDKKTKTLQKLTEGQKVYFKKIPDGIWSPGIIKSKCDQPRSYIVQGQDGSSVRRNRQHIHKYPETLPTYKDNISQSTFKQTNQSQHDVIHDPEGIRTRYGRSIKKPEKLNL